MFEYRPLNRERSEIRLVRFVDEPQNEAGDSDSESAQLELRHASLNETDIHYAALSYVWGSPTDMVEIHVNGSPFRVGRNLHGALMQLRRNDCTSWLWVDSICIQQSNIDEKEWQVSLMRSIFSQADRAHIWLGPGCKATDMAMDFLSRVGPRALLTRAYQLWPHTAIGDELYQYVWEKAECFIDSSRETNFMQLPEKNRIGFVWDLLNEPDLQREEHHLRGEEEDVLGGIESLMKRDYWHRIWVIQEVSLVKEALVLCGMKSMSLDMLIATLAAVSYCLFRRLPALHPLTQNFGCNLQRNFFENVPVIMRLINQYMIPGSMQIRLVDIVFQRGKPPGRPFYSATDPRDFVFGVLGLLSDRERLGLEVNYKMTVGEVFTALTRALIYDKRPNEFSLANVIPRGEAKLDISLPSWVPDWRDMGKYGRMIASVHKLVSLGATFGMSISVPPSHDETPSDLGLLRCQGCRVDIITEVMRPPRTPQWVRSDELGPSFIVDAHAWIDSVIHFANLGPEPAPGEDYVWQTMTIPGFGLEEETRNILRKIMRRKSIDAAELGFEQRCCICHMMGYKYDFRDQAARQSEDEILDQVAYLQQTLPEVYGNVCRERTFFKTAKGMFGRAHMAIRAGDMVVLLNRAKPPIILRPQDDASGGGFIFLGDAYVHGIMRGEFLQTLPVYEEFKIY